MIAVDEVPIAVAADALGFSADIISHLVKAGVIAGQESSCDLADAARVIDDLKAARKPVEGNPILLSEASAKYGFSVQSIHKWISQGWVKVIEPEPRRRVNEADTAMARKLADLTGHVPGKAVFPAKPRSGRPRKN